MSECTHPVKGSAIRVVGGPWPERIGLTGWIVKPTTEEAQRYPFHGHGVREVVIYLPDDPLNGPSTAYANSTFARRWTCVVNLQDIEVVR